jgi:DNA primase
MIYRGRDLNAVALWEQWCDFPPNFTGDGGGFSPLVICPNPEHNTDKRHFQVNLDKPLVHCFASCGISGTYERAISIITGCSEREARKELLKHARVGLGPRSKRKGRTPDGQVKRLQDEIPAPSLDYERYIPQAGMNYLSARGVGADEIVKWEIGWDPAERRIVIPAHDDRGIVRFLIKRAVSPKDFPKYLYWPEKALCGWGKTDILYGACRFDLKRVSSFGLVLVEGSLDTARIDSFGFPAGGILGTGLSEKQRGVINRTRPKRIFLMFDKDAAGVQNIWKAEAMLPKLPLFVCLYPKGKSDPQELTQEEAEYSIENALSLVRFKRRLPKRQARRKVTHGTAHSQTRS